MAHATIASGVRPAPLAHHRLRTTAAAASRLRSAFIRNSWGTATATQAASTASAFVSASAPRTPPSDAGLRPMRTPQCFCSQSQAHVHIFFVFLFDSTSCKLIIKAYKLLSLSVLESGEKSKALLRLIHATAKSSSSLNTYWISNFFRPAAMQRDTFSRARKILGIRILPRAPTLQTYLFWPIGMPEPRELAQYSSDSRFFWSSCNATSHIFTCAGKKKDPIWLPEIRLLHLGLSQRARPCCDDDAE